MTTKHAAITTTDGVHIVHGVAYANAANRRSHTGPVGDPWAATAIASLPVGLVAQQTDDNSYWILVQNAAGVLTWGRVEAREQVVSEHFPVTPDATVHAYWRVPYDCTVEAVHLTPVGDSAFDSPGSNCTISVSNFLIATEILSVASYNADGLSLNLPAELPLSATPANLDLTKGQLIQITMVFPADTTPVPVDGAATGFGLVDIVVRAR